MIIDIALLNEFNALHYRRRDSPGVILRERLESHNPSNYILKKERFNKGFNLNRTLVFLIITFKIKLAQRGLKISPPLLKSS